MGTTDIRILAAGAAVIAAAALAGCSSTSGSGSQQPTSPPASTPTSSPAGMTMTPPHTTVPVSGTPTTDRSAPVTAHLTPAGGPVPKGFEPASATFVSANTGWVLGTAPCSHAPCTSIVRTVDDGKSWVGIPAPVAPLGHQGIASSTAVTTLRFATTSDGWAAGGALYSTHDGGARWTRQHLPGSVPSLASGGGVVYAEVVSCPTSGCRGKVYASTIGSDSWAPVSGSFETGSGGLVVTGSGWFLPTRGGLLHGTGRSAAHALTSPCPTEGLQLAAADALHLDAMCAGDGAAGSARYQLYGTVDGGAHWVASGSKRLLPSDLTGVADNGQGVLMLAASSGGSALYRTTDDGVTLNRVPLSVAGGGIAWNDLGFTTASQGIVVLDRHGFYLTRDAGMSWAKVSF